MATSMNKKNGVNSSSRSNDNKKGDWSSGRGVLPGQEVMGPLALMIATPCLSIVFYHVCAHMQGNFLAFGQLVWQNGLLSTLVNIWPSPWDSTTWKMIGSFAALELLLVKYVPGPSFQASITPMGNVPVYKANGMSCYLITLITMLVLQASGLVSLAMVYDKFGHILSSMNVLAWGLCTVLLLKGHVAPSTTDSGTTGSLVYDFFWGMELYPRILGWDVKQVTNCRMGMMFWAVAIVCFAHKNMTTHAHLQLGMAVNVALQLVYITKFFYWEMGYMCSMDIQHDRAGYYLCWGCLVWLPAVYTSHSFYLAEHAPTLTPMTALAIFAMGLFCIFVNYDADHQRYVFRQTNGQCLIWGKVPKKIVATYYTTTAVTSNNNGSSSSQQQQKTSLLLVDGWWKYSRHFHYIPEILASVCWSLPALNTALVGPYFYAFYLTILLTDRAYRDDDRCSKKYGDSWKDYCEKVPYKIVPGIL